MGFYHVKYGIWRIKIIHAKSYYETIFEEDDCEKFFEETHSRDNTDQFIVRLPFRQIIKILGGFKFRADQQPFNQLQSKFHKDEEQLLESY